MARIRTIKPEFWDDELVGSMSPLARLVFIGCISHADDEGRMRGSAAFVRSQVFAYDDNTTTADVERALQELHLSGRITLYGSTQRYLLVVNFRRHQRIQRPQPSSLPSPSKANPAMIVEPSDLQDIPIPFRDHSDTAPRRVTDGMEREWNGMEKETSELARPTSDHADVMAVFDHWVSIAWTGRGRRPSIDDARRRRIRARLRTFTVDELKTALDGFSRSPFHNGEQNGVRQMKLATLLRDDEQVEKGIELATTYANASAAGMTPEQAQLIASLPDLGGAA